METSKSVAELCEQRGLAVSELATRCGLDERRIQAIVECRWTPSPQERDQIAAVFGLTRDQVAWSHRASVQHIQGHGPQFGRSP